MLSSMAIICFNPDCKNSISDRWRKGWRLRNNDFAKLCDRCGSIYEEGRFCETFHKYASGWRCCETCGKRVHCGCVVSIHAFSVLDAGGIDCAVCARKNAILTPNLRWPLQSLPGWLTECSNKNCNQTCGPGFPGWMQQMMGMYNKNNKFAVCSNLESSSYFAADTSTGCERPFWSNRLASIPSERNQCQNKCFSHGKANGSERREYGKSVFSCEEEVRSCLVNPGHQSFLKDRQSALHLGLNFSQLASQAENQLKVSDLHPQLLRPQNVVGKQHGTYSHNGSDSSHQIQVHNYRLVDVHGQKELLPRYRPNISGDELQQISGSSKSVTTPLFEKMLSASDVGRVGRLVLPKKCAESYFPPISHPEGLPLKVQDIKGNEWMFQFRFWPNNNSRMYVLEGITTCIQSLQLQAGDVVTFSRIEPEGKLIMGFRKASNGSQFKQGTQVVKSGHEVPTARDVDCQKPKLDEDLAYCHLKVKEAIGAHSNIPCKRKNVMVSSKRKCSRVNDVDSLELMVTLEEAQGLFRSSSDHGPSVEIIEEFKFEEFEDAPVIGRPTVFAKDSVGEDVQWAQCDDCLKWRKLPFDCILPSRWTCSKIFWDPDRSTCDAAQELSIEQLKVASKKLLDAQLDTHTSEVVQAFASFAIGDDETGPDSAQLTTKHPSHKPGCFCGVCFQPPGRKISKHELNCECIVCMHIQRQVRTMIHQKVRSQSGKEAETQKHSSQDKVCKWIRTMLRQSRSQSGKDAATKECGSQDTVQAPETSAPSIEQLGISCRSCVYTNGKVTCTPIEGEIDLNIKPERDEGASTCCRDATERGMCDSNDKMNCHGNLNESLSDSLVCHKHNLDISNENSNNHSVVENPPVVHLSISASVSR